MEIVVRILYIAIMVYVYTMIIYVLLSWIPSLRNSQIYRALGSICDPYLNIFRGKLVFGNMDFGGTIGILLLYILMTYLQTMVY